MTMFILIGIISVILQEKQKWEVKYEMVDGLMMIVVGIVGGCVSYLFVGGW